MDKECCSFELARRLRDKARRSKELLARVRAAIRRSARPVTGDSMAFDGCRGGFLEMQVTRQRAQRSR